MVQTARPVTAPHPQRPTPASCPRCGTPVSGIESTEPGRHAFADCGHDASTLRLTSLTAR